MVTIVRKAVRRGDVGASWLTNRERSRGIMYRLFLKRRAFAMELN